jgi:threonine dehydrogenase-like Zn-dependent dehydrogenase
MSDEAAVLIEPLAGGIHAALMAIRSIAQNEHAAQTTEPVIAVLGAGTMGLAAIAGLRKFAPSAKIIVGARYSVQHRFASALGATEVVSPDDLARAVRRHTGCHMVGDYLSSGAHATIDAVGNSASVDQCIRLTRPRSTVVLMGMPANVSVDMTGLWHRETKLAGSYTYGTEILSDGRSARTFDLAIELAAEIGADRLLSATYRLHEYADALAHAGASGARGDFKIAFDLRPINKESH